MSLKTRLADIQEKWEKLGISEKRIQILPGNVFKTLLASFDEFTRLCSLFCRSDLFLQRHVIGYTMLRFVFRSFLSSIREICCSTIRKTRNFLPMYRKRVDRFMYIMQWPHKSKSSIFIAINRVQVYQRSYRLVELSCKNWKCTLRSSVYVRSV